MVESWHRNAPLWIQAVRGGCIPSRVKVTNDAIVEAVLRLAPRRVLDIGCGEGWLARQLPAHVTGFDVSPQLVEAARRDSPGEYHVLSYAEFVAGPRRAGPGFDLAVANFSLFERDLVPLLRAVAEIAPWLIVQTLHPSAAEPGPRLERFDSLASLGDWAPMEWHSRTREDWISQLEAAGFAAAHVEEPGGLSLLITARRASSPGTEMPAPPSTPA